MRVRVAPLIDRRAAVADVVKIGVAGIEAVELRDHGVSLLWALLASLAAGRSILEWIARPARRRPCVAGGADARKEEVSSPLSRAEGVFGLQDRFAGVHWQPWRRLSDCRGAKAARRS